MAFADFQAKQKQNKQRGIVREFFEKYNGRALCLSDDPTFVVLLRTIFKEMQIPVSGTLVTIPAATSAFKEITDAFADGKKPILFMERTLNEIGDTGFLLKQSRDTFPKLKIIVLTTTAEKERIMLLSEAGVDGFVLKPISVNDLMEKFAVAVQPPGPFRQLLDKARELVVNNISDQALFVSKKVLEIKPDSAAGYVVLGDALRIAGDIEKAKAAYERACKYSGDYLEPLQRMADLAKETGQKELQLEYLKRLDAVSPLNAQRKVEIGELHIALGNTEAATQLFDNAVSRVYKDAMAQVAAMTEKIAVSLQDSDPVQAEKYLRKCLELKGRDLSVDDIATFNQLGISLRRQGRWEDAITEYKRALGIAPNAEGLFYNIAMAYGEGRDYESAVRFMQKALSLNPDLPWQSATLAYNMGKVFSLGYTLDKAKQCLEIALKLNPELEDAKASLNRLRQLETEQA